MSDNIYYGEISYDFTVILPAAGVGRRMRKFLPKQYCVVGKKTILEHSINLFINYAFIKQIIVVINYRDSWFDKLSIASNPKIKSIKGGKTRADSVLAALQYMDSYENKCTWVVIHDAVRPFMHISDFINLLKVTSCSSIGAILAVPVSDTIKYSCDGTNIINHTVNRNNLWHALTPQLFNFSLLKSCLSNALENGIIITDESSALEYFGYYPQLVHGRSDNIKITYPEDLLLADFYLSNFLKKGITNACRSWF